MIEIIILAGIVGFYSGYEIFKCYRNRIHNNIIPEVNNIIPEQNIIRQQNIIIQEQNIIRQQNTYSDFSMLYYHIGDKKECSICLEHINKNHLIRVLKCFHIYHDECISEWLNKKKICPECNMEF